MNVAEEGLEIGCLVRKAQPDKACPFGRPHRRRTQIIEQRFVKRIFHRDEADLARQIILEAMPRTDESSFFTMARFRDDPRPAMLANIVPCHHFAVVAARDNDGLAQLLEHNKVSRLGNITRRTRRKPALEKHVVQLALKTRRIGIAESVDNARRQRILLGRVNTGHRVAFHIEATIPVTLSLAIMLAIPIKTNDCLV